MNDEIAGNICTVGQFTVGQFFVIQNLIDKANNGDKDAATIKEIIDDLQYEIESRDEEIESLKEIIEEIEEELKEINKDSDWICSDCAMVVASGDTSGMDDETIARVTATACDSRGTWVLGDQTDEFSRQSCDRCGTTLAGERISANILER